MRMLRVVAALGVAVAWILLTASPAHAHVGDEVGPTNYDSIVKDVSPSLAGIHVRSIDLASGIELRNESGAEVLVLGYEDEPYLRVDDEGVWENRRSPATYLNASKDGGVPVPENATADADPAWTKVSDGNTVRWHDHRAHWMASNDPPAVQRDPSRSHVVVPDWQIPIVVGQQKVTITGDLVWSPGRDAAPAGAAAVALGCGVVALAWLLPRGRRFVLAALCLAMVATSFALSVGEAFAPELTGPVLPRFLAGGALILLIGWLGGVIAAAWLSRTKPAEGVQIAGVAGLTVALGSGLAAITTLTRPYIAFSWSDTIARTLVIANIGLGAGVGLAAVAAVRWRWFTPAKQT